MQYLLQNLESIAILIEKIQNVAISIAKYQSIAILWNTIGPSPALQNDMDVDENKFIKENLHVICVYQLFLCFITLYFKNSTGFMCNR